MNEPSLLTRGLIEVTLPSGARVRGVLPTLNTLLRQGLVPDRLRSAALATADPEWLTTARTDEEQRDAGWLIAVQIAAYLREEWRDEAWQRLTVTPEDVLTGTMDERDIDSLTALVTGLWGPDTVTALATGLFLTPRAEAADTADLAPFRDQRGGPADGADGGPMASATVGRDGA